MSATEKQHRKKIVLIGVTVFLVVFMVLSIILIMKKENKSSTDEQTPTSTIEGSGEQASTENVVLETNGVGFGSNIIQDDELEIAEKISDQEYIDSMLEFRKEFTMFSTTFGVDGNQSDAEEIQKEYNDLLEGVLKLNPSPAMQRVHLEYKILVTEVKSIADAYYADHNNIYQLFRNDEFLNATLRMGYAHKWLETVTNVPSFYPNDMGSDDVNKERKKKFNIDEETVLYNISKSGEEMIGKWAINSTDASKISLVLNADGTYQGYNEGQYDQKITYLNGVWNYDYHNLALILHTTDFIDNTLVKEYDKFTYYAVERMEKNLDELQIADYETHVRFVFKRVE